MNWTRLIVSLRQRADKRRELLGFTDTHAETLYDLSEAIQAELERVNDEQDFTRNFDQRCYK